jgi:hypothetical protein
MLYVSSPMTVGNPWLITLLPEGVMTVINQSAQHIYLINNDTEIDQPE